MSYKDIFWSAYFSSFKIANLSIYRTKVDCTPRISLVEHWQVLERHLDKVADSRKWDLRSIVGAKEQPEREVQHIRSYLWDSRHMCICDIIMSERLVYRLCRLAGLVEGMCALVAYRNSHDVKYLGCWRMETYAQAPENRRVVKHLA